MHQDKASADNRVMKEQTHQRELLTRNRRCHKCTHKWLTKHLKLNKMVKMNRDQIIVVSISLAQNSQRIRPGWNSVRTLNLQVYNCQKLSTVLGSTSQRAESYRVAQQPCEEKPSAKTTSKTLELGKISRFQKGLAWVFK
jgi:hypothetical protein